MAAPKATLLSRPARLAAYLSLVPCGILALAFLRPPLPRPVVGALLVFTIILVAAVAWLMLRRAKDGPLVTRVFALVTALVALFLLALILATYLTPDDAPIGLGIVAFVAVPALAMLSWVVWIIDSDDE